MYAYDCGGNILSKTEYAYDAWGSILSISGSGAGTKNGAFISWMDPRTNTEVFRWDENPNYSNGPHYHIYGAGHYYPGTIVPEPYATSYFPFR